MSIQMIGTLHPNDGTGKPDTSTNFYPATPKFLAMGQDRVTNNNGYTIEGLKWIHIDKPEKIQPDWSKYYIDLLCYSDGDPVLDIQDLQNYMLCITGSDFVPYYEQRCPNESYIFSQTDDALFKYQYVEDVGLLTFRVDGKLPFAKTKYALPYKIFQSVKIIEKDVEDIDTDEFPYQYAFEGELEGDLLDLHIAYSLQGYEHALERHATISLNSHGTLHGNAIFMPTDTNDYTHISARIFGDDNRVVILSSSQLDLHTLAIKGSYLELTSPATTGEMKIIFTWNNITSDLDLDAHLITYPINNRSQHCCWDNKYISEDGWAMQLDTDYSSGDDPREILTIEAKPDKGDFVYYIYNYNAGIVEEQKDSPYGKHWGQLKTLNATVKIYFDDVLYATYIVPQQDGICWPVFAYKNGSIVPINKIDQKILPNNTFTNYKNYVGYAEDGNSPIELLGRYLGYPAQTLTIDNTNSEIDISVVQYNGSTEEDKVIADFEAGIKKTFTVPSSSVNCYYLDFYDSPAEATATYTGTYNGATYTNTNLKIGNEYSDTVISNPEQNWEWDIETAYNDGNIIITAGEGPSRSSNIVDNDNIDILSADDYGLIYNQ